MQIKRYLRKQEKIKRLEEKEKHFKEVQKPLLDKLWGLMLTIGRIPKEEEVTWVNDLKTEFGSLNKALNRALSSYPNDDFKEAFKLKKEDLDVYFANLSFDKKVRNMKYFSETLQTDIKEFYGSYKKARECIRT